MIGEGLLDRMGMGRGAKEGTRMGSLANAEAAEEDGTREGTGGIHMEGA